MYSGQGSKSHPRVKRKIQMNDDFRDQMLNNLNLKETDELLEIWQNRNPDEWTELAFDIIEEILKKRLGEIPPLEDVGGEDEIFQLDNESNIENDIPKGIDRVCPNCKGRNLLIREVGISNGSSKVILIKSGDMLQNFLGMGEKDEIIGIACEDCGFVYFMLKGYL